MTWKNGDLALCIATCKTLEGEIIVRSGETHTVSAVFNNREGKGLVLKDVQIPAGYAGFAARNFIRIDPDNLIDSQWEFAE